MVATSGGSPPSIAVDSTVGTLSPAGLYLTLTFGYFLLNPSSTAWKDFCSCAVQMPTTEMLPETLDVSSLAPPPVAPPPPASSSSSPPQPASAVAVSASAARARNLNDFMR